LGGVAAVIVGLVVWAGPTVWSLYSHGFFEKPEKESYVADRKGNLEAIRRALMAYHDSEGAFPVADTWMDAIAKRLQTGTMSEADSKLKLIRPDLQEGPGGRFGYSFNDHVSSKYIDDVGSKKTVLVWESEATNRNAHGVPASPPEGMAIDLDGTIFDPAEKAAK